MLNDIDSIYNSINTLVDSSKKLKSGSGQLLEGANKLKDGIIKLKDGINSAYNGSKQITDGVAYSIDQLNKDNSPALTDEQLAAIKTQAEAGAKQKVSATFTDQYKSGIANQAWNTVKENMNPNDQEVIGIVTDATTTAITNAVNSAIVSYLTETNQLADYQTCEANERQHASCLNVDYKALEYIKNAATTAATNAAKSTASNVSVYVAENVSKQVSVSVAENTALATAENTAGTVSTNVASQIATQAKQTAKTQTTESLTTLLNGLNQLTNGLNEINNKMVDLDTGTSTLKDGISALDNGIYQFNSQGINKISDLVNGDVRTLEEKIKVLGKLSTTYGTFDDSESGTEGVTKIIMIVDEISADQTNITPVDKIIEETKSLWDKAKENLKNKKKEK